MKTITLNFVYLNFRAFKRESSIVLLFFSFFILMGFGEPLIKKNDRVAVIGDSITEQKQYCRFIEMYLTVCQPQLETEVFQFGWGGETASGFLQRMDMSLKFFRPTFATLCYGMNDASYKPYEPSIGAAYENALTQVVQKLKTAKTTVLVGGPGAVDTDIFKSGSSPATYNINLNQLTIISKKIAVIHGFSHANLHQSMLESMAKAKAALGKEYIPLGPDGFHPFPSGHLIMAYSFLKSMGFDGDLGTITFDLKGNATAVGGHEIKSSANGKMEIESKRYPFCFFGDNKSPQSAASMLPYLPFNAELNRLTLKVNNASSSKLKVTWGNASKEFTKEELQQGINLAAEFIPNPFNEAFARVDAAVVVKENFETEFMKVYLRTLNYFRLQSKEGKEILAATDLLEKKAEDQWRELSKSTKESFKPVTHTLTVEPVLN